MELRVPDASAFHAAARIAAARVGRTLPSKGEGLTGLVAQLAREDVRGLSSPALVALTVRAALHHRLYGADLEAAAWASALAVARVNDLHLNVEDGGALLGLTDAGLPPVVDLEGWAARQLEPAGQLSRAVPASPVRAVLATARTGHPRERLNGLDQLAGAASRRLQQAGIEVADLALGERYPRSPAQSYSHDRRAAESCDLLVAFLHPPSIGVGMVIEMALRQYPVTVFVAAPGEPLSPLPVGLHTYPEIIFAAGERTLIAGLEDVLERRGRDLLAHSERRLERPSRWGALQARTLVRSALPRWLPLRRAKELLDEPGRAAAASSEELEALASAVGTRWAGLGEVDESSLAVAGAEHRLIFNVGICEGWDLGRVLSVVDAVDLDRRAPAGDALARASLRLDSAADVLRYVQERGL